MNEIEKKRAFMTRKELGEEEYQRILDMIGKAKRFAELLALIPGMKEQIDNNPEEVKKKYGLEGVDFEDLKLQFYNENKLDFEKMLQRSDALDQISEINFRYRQYCENKWDLRNRMRKSLCIPTHEKLKKWRQIQMARGNGSMGGTNEAFIHNILNFEMSVGCSVGCPFCGVGAMKLQKVFFHTEENQKLFIDVLNVCKELFGDAAGRGTLYLASEPLDNPDYEKFEDDFFEIFKRIPQITTAVPNRNPERTRKLVAELYEKNSLIHRFSIRSLEEAELAFKNFTPKELASVELLPQFEEAPGFHAFSTAGGQRQHLIEKEGSVEQMELDMDEDDPGSICCVDGFVVNFCEKSIKVITPCRADMHYPDGVAGSGKVYFTDAEDFRDKITGLIDDYMVISVPSDVKLKIYPYFKMIETEDGHMLESIHGGYRIPIEKSGLSGMKRTVELLMEGKYTKEEIVNIVVDEMDVAPERVFWDITQLYRAGAIIDPVLFGYM